MRCSFGLSDIIITDLLKMDTRGSGAGLTAPLCRGGDGAGLLASSQSRIRLQVDGVGGGRVQVIDLVSEGGLTDSLL